MYDETKMILALIADREYPAHRNGVGMQMALDRYEEYSQTNEGKKILQDYTRTARSYIRWMQGGQMDLTPEALKKYGWKESPVILEVPRLKIFGIGFFHKPELQEGKWKYERGAITVWLKEVSKNKYEKWFSIGGTSPLRYPDLMMKDLAYMEVALHQKSSGDIDGFDDGDKDNDPKPKKDAENKNGKMEVVK